MYIAIDRNDPRSLKGLTSFITRKIRCSLTPSRHKYISLAYNTSDRLPNDADPVTHMLFILNTPPHRKGLFLTQNLNNRRTAISRPFHFSKVDFVSFEWNSFCHFPFPHDPYVQDAIGKFSIFPIRSPISNIFEECCVIFKFKSSIFKNCKNY